MLNTLFREADRAALARGGMWSGCEGAGVVAEYKDVRCTSSDLCRLSSGEPSLSPLEGRLACRYGQQAAKMRGDEDSM